MQRLQFQAVGQWIGNTEEGRKAWAESSEDLTSGTWPATGRLWKASHRYQHYLELERHLCVSKICSFSPIPSKS